MTEMSWKASKPQASSKEDGTHNHIILLICQVFNKHGLDSGVFFENIFLSASHDNYQSPLQ